MNNPLTPAVDSAAARPKVSVCVITYNHERYIAECLQSIVDQVTDFPFEVVVGEDLSTDNTRAVVAEFAQRYPALIRPIYQSRNINSGAHNFRVVHLAARGQYVAHLDGDDYMLPGKLQAQADVLDAYPDVEVSAHAVALECEGHVTEEPQDAFPERADVYDLLRLGTYFVHSSIMYRRDSGGVEKLPEICVDYYMHIDRASRGLVHFNKRVLGVYRVLQNGLSRTPQHMARSEKLYDAAYDHALSLGLDRDRVQRARLDRRMKFAITRNLAGDVAGYRTAVRVSPVDWPLASTKHRVLHLTRRFPWVVGGYFAGKRWMAAMRRLTGRAAR